VAVGRPTLPPLDLGARLDRILACAGELVAAFPSSALDQKPPQRYRSVRDLAFHIFRAALAYVDGMDMGELRDSWLQEEAPPELIDGSAVARYGALVRGRVSGWFEGAAPSEYARVIEGCYGAQTGHHLLWLTTCDAARHLRELYAIAVALGITPPEPLPTSDFEGLPLQASLW